MGDVHLVDRFLTISREDCARFYADNMVSIPEYFYDNYHVGFDVSPEGAGLRALYSCRLDDLDELAEQLLAVGAEGYFTVCDERGDPDTLRQYEFKDNKCFVYAADIAWIEKRILEL